MAKANRRFHVWEKKSTSKYAHDGCDDRLALVSYLPLHHCTTVLFRPPGYSIGNIAAQSRHTGIQIYKTNSTASCVSLVQTDATIEQT
eukprot:scaffold9784_cov78-Skeletonema_dohrnii-CCMP3373.AAC.2